MTTGCGRAAARAIATISARSSTRHRSGGAARCAGASRGLVATQSTPRKLAAIMMADIAGFSRLMERDESATFARLQHLREAVTQPKIDAYGGRLVKTTGDGFLVEFASATDALCCALDIQRDLIAREAERSTDDRIRLRIGINVGDIIVDGDDIAGDGVNIAARLETLALPGGICISGTVREQIHDDLGIALSDLGPQKLKNITREVRAFAVTPTSGAVETPGDTSRAAHRFRECAAHRGPATPGHIFSVDRRASLRQPGRRRERVLRRRARRRASQRAREDPRIARRLADVGVLLQGQGRRHSDGRAET